MVLESAFQVFLVGFAGGLLLEILHWYNLSRDANFTAYKRSPFYWIFSIAMAAAGGFLSFLYFGDHAEGLLALHVGISAPLILQKLASTAAQQGGKSGRPSPTGFISW